MPDPSKTHPEPPPVSWAIAASVSQPPRERGRRPVGGRPVILSLVLSDGKRYNVSFAADLARAIGNELVEAGGAL